MKIVPTATSWGTDFSDSTKWDEAIESFAKNGYEALEVVPLSISDREKFGKLLRKYNLRAICQIHTSATFENGVYNYISSNNPEVHLELLPKQLEMVSSFPTVIVNLHGGHDSWDDETAAEFIINAIDIGDSILDQSIPMVFETHRTRVFFNPWQTLRILRNPQVAGRVKLNADLSHWAVVCSRVFGTFEAKADGEQWDEVLDAVAEHTFLIHCRVGCSYSAQVADLNDPHPDVQSALSAHLGYWKKIWKAQERRGMKESFNEMEFGPYPYLPILPFTHQPIVDQQEANLVMKDKVIEAFESTVR